MIRIVSLRLDGRRTDGYRSGCLADRTNPVLSWAAVSDQTEDRQSAYRVTAGSWISAGSPAKASSAAPPGYAVAGDAHSRDPVPAQPRRRNQPALHRHAAQRRGGGLDAPGIGLDDAQPERVIYLRRQLNLTQPVRHARLDLCGLGYHAAWINGTRLDDARLDPAFMDYSKHIPFVSYLEAAPLFHPGENEVIVAVGSGWRRNGRLHENQWFHGVSFPFEGPQQERRACATLADGTTWRLTTDETGRPGMAPWDMPTYLMAPCMTPGSPWGLGGPPGG